MSEVICPVLTTSVPGWTSISSAVAPLIAGIDGKLDPTKTDAWPIDGAAIGVAGVERAKGGLSSRYTCRVGETMSFASAAGSSSFHPRTKNAHSASEAKPDQINSGDASGTALMSTTKLSNTP